MGDTQAKILLTTHTMNQTDPAEHRPLFVRLGAIACVVGVLAFAFVYAGGWLTPDRITPAEVVARFTPPGVDALGHRRNHAKGICFTGLFESNGAGAALSRAPMLAAGQFPVLGRFNLGVGDPNAADMTARVRGLGLQISAPGNQVWRAAMINAPVFAVSTPQEFFTLLGALGSKDPTVMPAFVAAHPEFAGFAHWAGTAPWTSSYAEDQYNGLNAFLFADASGAEHAVRWSFVPAATPVVTTPADLGKRGPNGLEQEITERVKAGPQRWTLRITVANPGDPTSDPTKAWPADRRTVDAGTLTVQRIEPEADGPCRDINFDPTILPSGIRVSDDPFPAARSAVYARSFDMRTAEERDYPRTTAGAAR